MDTIAKIIHKCAAGDDGSFGHIHIDHRYLMGTMHGIDFKNMREYRYAVSLLNRLTRRGVLTRKHKSLYIRKIKYIN